MPDFDAYRTILHYNGLSFLLRIFCIGMEFIDKKKKMHTNTKHPTFPIITSSMFVMQTLY
jgi:hypothetical protein